MLGLLWRLAEGLQMPELTRTEMGLCLNKGTFESGICENLLENPNFTPVKWGKEHTAVSVATAPWDVMSDDHGFVLERVPQGSTVQSLPLLAADSGHCLVGSSKRSSRVQIINLHKRLSKDSLITGKFTITACNWVCCRYDTEATAYMKVTLLDSKREPISGGHYDSGHITPCDARWRKISCCFHDISPNVKYIRFEDGSYGPENAEGHFGPKITGTSVRVVPSLKKDTFSSENMLKNPSFSPVQGTWNAEKATTDIDTLNWQTGDPYELQQQKDSSGNFNPNDWCIATKGLAQRTQMVYLTDYCSAETLDGVNRPRIVLATKYSSLQNYPGTFTVKLEVTDDSGIPIRVCAKNSSPSTSWTSCRLEIKNYPPGVRAFVYTESCRLHDPDRAKDFVGIKVYHPAVKLLPGNLLKNSVFAPKSGCDQKDQLNSGSVDVHPWKIVSGEYQLEESVTDNTLEPSGHCLFAVSTDWFIRRQEIDLEANGYDPRFIDTHRPTIKVFEWFAARNDCVGIGFVKVDLLDKDRKSVNSTFSSGKQLFASSHWTKISFKFNDYPEGVRYICFEDGGQGLQRCRGHFGPKMIGAEVLMG